MKSAVIINDSAGSGAGEDEPARIEMAFKSANVSVDIIKIPGNQIKSVTAEVINAGYDNISAAGGDGTINSVLNGAGDSEIPFGIIPTGTLNHFAKDAGIPLNIEEAVAVITSQNIRPIDIAEVNGHYFINNSSIGLYPKIVKHRDKEMEILGFGKWYAMFRAIKNIFKRFPVLSLNVLAEDHYNKVQTPFLFIGNNKYSFDLFNLGIREKLSEGLLSLYYPKYAGKFAMFRFALLALINRLHQEEDFVNTTSGEVQIFSNRKELEVAVDGEVLHLTPPLYYKIHPGKLKLLVPENK